MWPIFHSLKESIDLFLSSKLPYKTLERSYKNDGTWITELDLFVHQKALELFPSNYHIISEENEKILSTYPLPRVIIDPIDGTREIIKETYESTVSIFIQHENDFRSSANLAWIYNPFTKTEFFSSSPSLPLGLISRRDLFVLANLSPSPKTVCFLPLGSIAYKLSLLSSGIGDFVLSLGGKNIWDLAAGHSLCLSKEIQGFHLSDQSLLDLTFYTQNPLVQIPGPLVWCDLKKSQKILPLLTKWKKNSPS